MSGGDALAVRRLRLTDFRNYAALSLDLSETPVVLTGPNGAGKTNLLEAVSYLAPGRGLRRAKLGTVTREGGAAWAVAATLGMTGQDVRIGTGLANEDGSDRRIVKIDGKMASGPAALSDQVRMVWLTPQMDRLFLEGPSARRRFVDRLTLGLDAEHGRVAGRFERAMRERTKLLTDGPRDAAWLSILEESMAEAGTAMAAARRDMIARLGAALAAGIGPFPKAAVRMHGSLEDALEAAPAVEVETAYKDRLKALRGTDAAAGRATEGPHLSDLSVLYDQTGRPAEDCSTGEQKALLIAIILASARLQAGEWGAAPLVLLDEVVAHLDAGRREALLEELRFLGAQAWMTGTDKTLFEPLLGRAQFLVVSSGTVQED